MSNPELVRPSDDAVIVLQEIARLTNLYLGGGCCGEHQNQNLSKLHKELSKFEDDSFAALKTADTKGETE